jgi:hypothetical protein
LPGAQGGSAAPDETSRTATVERAADPCSADLAGLCDAAWRDWIMEKALEELQSQTRAEHYQIFHHLVVERRPAPEVARMFQRPQAAIYIIKFRLSGMLKKIAQGLKKSLD